MAFQETISLQTRGRGTYEITREVRDIVSRSGVETGLCQVFVQHTSASLLICENADPVVHDDLERFISRLVPDGDPIYRHTMEGPDDMAAHVRTVLTNPDLGLPVSQGQAALGTWQGIYLYEHRTHPHRRNIVVTVL